MNGARVASACLSSLVIVACVASAPAADRAKGSIIEVREGDTWTKATVIESEGRRVHVRYDDNSDEWVGPDRLRDNGTGATPKPASPPDATPAPTPAATPGAKPARRGFAAGEEIEVKYRGEWHDADLVQIDHDWNYVVDRDDRAEKRWVEAWSLRVPGSGYDIDAEGTKSWPLHEDAAAPAKVADKSPPAVGDPYSVAPAGLRAITPKTLEQDVDKVTFENASEPAPIGTVAAAAIATTQPTSEFNAWALRGVESRLDRAVPCAGNPLLAVASFPGSFGRWSTVVRTSLLDRRQLDTRTINVTDLKILSAADGGDTLLSTQGFFGKNVQLWHWESGSYRLKSNLSIESDTMAHVDDAQLLSADRALVSESSGTVYLIDLAGKRVISSLHGAPDAHAFFHPSGKLTGVVGASGAATILRSEDLAIVAQFDEAGSKSNVAIDPTGRFAAYIGNDGAARVVKIADGAKLGSVWVGIAFKGRLDLVDDRCLLVDHATVYDVKTGVPAWTYKMPADVTAVAPLTNGQFLIGAAKMKMAALATASLPDAAGRAGLKPFDAKQYQVVPGTSVTVDADYGIFGNDRDKAADAMAEVLAGSGLRLSKNDEPIHLKLTAAGGPSEKRDYAPDMFTPPPRIATTVDVPLTIVTATLTNRGTPIWTQELRFAAGSSIERRSDQTMQDAANEAAKPTVAALRTLAVPAYLRLDAKPGAPVTFGVSTMQDHRFAPDVPPAANKIAKR